MQLLSEDSTEIICSRQLSLVIKLHLHRPRPDGFFVADGVSLTDNKLLVHKPLILSHHTKVVLTHKWMLVGESVLMLYCTTSCSFEVAVGRQA